MSHSRFYGCTYIWKQIDIIDCSLPNKAQETESWNNEGFEQKNWDFYLIFPNLIWISYRLFDAKLSIFSRLSKMTSNYNIYFTLDYFSFIVIVSIFIFTMSWLDGILCLSTVKETHKNQLQGLNVSNVRSRNMFVCLFSIF